MASEREVAYNPEPVIASGRPAVDAYHQKINDLGSLPQTNLVPAEQLDGNMPNIFTAEEPRWRKDAETVPLYVKAAKADVGGVGGHVVVDPEVKAAFADHILRYNRFRDRPDRPIFRSVFFTHTGDDVCAVGVIDGRSIDHPEVADELLWNAFQVGAEVAKKLGNYAPGQDLKADAFSGNIRGMGPGSVLLPLPFRPNSQDTSQTVLVATADKTEPGTYNYITRGAYLDPKYNTGLLIAKSDMKRGYVFKIIDVDTKQQAIDSGINPSNEEAMNAKMEELSKTERSIMLKGPENLYDIAALTMNSSRFVIAEVWTKDEDDNPKDLGLVVSAERLHNIKDQVTGRFVYGGKDDPVMLALAQGSWPAPGEIISPIAEIPIVAGDCRGSHFLPLYPTPINSQTSYWSGPIMSAITASINLETGRIGSISDQIAKGTPWDGIRDRASDKIVEFRKLGYTHPGTLGTGEMEYQDGYVERMNRLSSEFSVKDLVK